MTREQELEAEILRLRTAETASAHALDRIRQHIGLELVPQEHPSDTASRIEEAWNWTQSVMSFGRTRYDLRKDP